MTDAGVVHTLAFFPWFQLREPVDAGPFELVPYHRGRTPGGQGSDVQKACDAILETYRTAPRAVVSRAMLLRIAGGGVTDLVEDDHIHRLLIWGELVAFAGLSTRRFFDETSYVNRDALRLVVQQFADPTRGVGMQFRRRDGSSNVHVTRGAAVFPRPLHAVTGLRGEIDVPLLQALTTRAEQDGWGRYQEAIQSFNAANTDDPSVLEESEIVTLVGALERLFDLSRGKEDELAAEVIRALDSGSTMSPLASLRVGRSPTPVRYTGRDSMREVWIRDVFQLRGQHAHGKIEPRMTTLWSRREHLLFASFAFPLILKHELAREGFYTLTLGDKGRLAAFEELLDPDHFLVRDPFHDGPYPWSEVLSRTSMRAWINERLAAHHEQNDSSTD